MKYIKFEGKIYQEVTMVAVEEVEEASKAIKVQRLPAYNFNSNHDLRITEMIREENPLQRQDRYYPFTVKGLN